MSLLKDQSVRRVTGSRFTEVTKRNVIEKGWFKDPVTMKDIAPRLKVSFRTVVNWNARDLLPYPKLKWGTTYVWEWDDVKNWHDQRETHLKVPKTFRGR